MEAAQEGAVALVAVVNEEDERSGVAFETRHVSIILEDEVVMTHRSWPDSLVILFGLIYALNLSYVPFLSSSKLYSWIWMTGGSNLNLSYRL